MYEECDCSECCPDVSSSVGAQGIQGPDGNGDSALGPPGEQGFQSETQFPQGMDGYQGMIGSDALRGNPGVQGFDALALRGFQGSDGFQGDARRGPQGNVGDLGAAGYVGSSIRGPQGVPGINGSQGYFGMQGFLSYVGAQGVNGSQGVKGDWLNYIYASLGTQGPTIGTSAELGTFPAPPIDSFFTFSCMAYGPQGTKGTFEVWQGTHIPANTLSSQPWEFPTYFATSDRVPFSVNVPIALFTNSSPITVGFYSIPPGTFLNTETSTYSLVQNATHLH